MVADTTRAKKAPSEESGKKKRETKATTGAWWKSTVSEVESKEEEKAVDKLTDKSKEQDGSAKKPQKPRPPRTRKTGRKKAAPKSGAEYDASESPGAGIDAETR